MEAAKVLNSTYTNQQQAQCVRWILKWPGVAATRRRFSCNTVYELQLGMQAFFGTNVITTVEATLIGEMEGQKWACKSKSGWSRCFKPTKGFCFEKSQPFEGSVRQLYGILRKRLKMFLYGVQIKAGLSETDKVSRVAFRQLGKEKLKKNLKFLKRSVVSEGEVTRCMVP